MRSFKLTLTDKARSDLRAIYDYIADKNPDAASRFLQDLTKKIFDLAEQGVTGVSRDLVSKGLRCFPYRERCFYFRIINDEMIVIRVLHGRQDVGSQEFTEE